MIKPLIRLYWHYPNRNFPRVWQCVGGQIAGYGKSPNTSYVSWRVQYDAEQARKSKLAEKFSPAR
jgi:hypothetical protein